VSLAPFSRIASVLTFFFFWSRITLNCCYFKRIAAVAASTAKLPFSMPFLLSAFTSLFRYLFLPTKTRQRTQFLHNALNIPVLCFIFCSWIPSFNLNGKRLLPSNLPASGKTSIPWGNFRRGGVPHFPLFYFLSPILVGGNAIFMQLLLSAGVGFEVERRNAPLFSNCVFAGLRTNRPRSPVGRNIHTGKIYHCAKYYYTYIIWVTPLYFEF